MEEFWESVKTYFTNFFSDGGITIVRTIAFALLGLVILKIVQSMTKRIALRSKLDNAAVSFVISIITVILYIVLIIVIISSLGFSTAAIVSAFSAVVLAIGIALQDSLASLANGVIIIFTKPFKKGDFIEINGIEGTVQDIRLFNTKILTSNNEEVIVPNSDILSETLTNESTMPMRRVEINFYLPYSADAENVRGKMLKKFEENAYILETPAPQVSLDSFGEDTVACTAYAWSDCADYGKAKTAVKEIIYEVIRDCCAAPSSRRVQIDLSPDEAAAVVKEGRDE